MKQRITSRIYKLTELMGSAYPMLSDDLARIEGDYQQMADFFMTGQVDPQIERVYSDIDARLTRLTATYTLHKLCTEAPLYKRMQELLKGDTILDIQQIQNEMERYEIDLTMLELEASEETRRRKQMEISAGQYTLRQKIFAKFLLSPLWSKGTADLIRELMLMPTVDRIAVELMITATMLSCMNIFDENKYTMLYRLHKEAEDVAIRQKSAVAVMLLSQLCGNVVNEEMARQTNLSLKDFPMDEALLTATQKMMVYTIDSESIGRRIERELMPEIIKSSEISIKNGKIVERPVDRIEDIINPNKDEESIEKIEEAIQRMQAMQKDGADIFYAGFSHVKRHPFFNNPVHWFFPFTRNHPALNSLKLDEVGEKVLGNLIRRTPFCESDKYSFVLMMGQVFAQLPQNIKELLASGEADLALAGSYTKFKPEILERRKYLQDLFRFFKLSPFTDKLYNPFTRDHMLFMRSYLETDGPLKDEPERLVKDDMNRLVKDETVKVIVQFLRSIDKLGAAGDIIKVWQPDDLKMRIFGAFVLMESGDEGIALERLEAVLEEHPDNLQAIYGLGKCLWLAGSPSLVRMHREKVLNALLALHFKNESDRPTHNLLAKMYILCGEYEKALHEIKLLFEADAVEPDLLMVTVYIYFLRGKQAVAVTFLKAYKQIVLDMPPEYDLDMATIADDILHDFLEPAFGKTLSPIADDILEHYIGT